MRLRNDLQDIIFTDLKVMKIIITDLIIHAEALSATIMSLIIMSVIITPVGVCNDCSLIVISLFTASKFD